MKKFLMFFLMLTCIHVNIMADYESQCEICEQPVMVECDENGDITWGGGQGFLTSYDGSITIQGWGTEEQMEYERSLGYEYGLRVCHYCESRYQSKLRKQLKDITDKLITNAKAEQEERRKRFQDEKLLKRKEKVTREIKVLLEQLKELSEE